MYQTYCSGIALAISPFTKIKQLKGHWLNYEEALCVDAFAITGKVHLTHCAGDFTKTSAITCEINLPISIYQGHLEFYKKQVSETPMIVQLWVHIDGTYFYQHYHKDHYILTLPHDVKNNPDSNLTSAPPEGGIPTLPGTTTGPSILLPTGGAIDGVGIS